MKPEVAKAAAATGESGAPEAPGAVPAEFFRLAVEASPVGKIIADRLGQIVLVNAQAEKLFGYDRSELLGKPVEMLVPRRLRERHPGFREGFWSEPRARPMGAGRDLFGLRKDGTEIPIEIGLTPLSAGGKAYVLSSVVEITERKRAEEQFRLAIEAAPTGMMMVDGGGYIVLVNAQVEKLFGYTRDELIGAPVEMLVPERYRAGHPVFRSGFFTNPNARPMGAGRDLFGLRKDGTEVPIEIGLNPLTTSAGRFVLSSIVDITERRRTAEQLRASLQEKETLLKEVHHRVKNNLQVISSLLSLQSRSVEDPRAAAMLQESQNRVHSISLVHEKLYEAGDLGRVDFGDYLQALGNHLQGAWAGTEGRVSITVDATGLRLPLDVAIPCGLIVNELVTNAFKHAFPGGRAGAVRVRASVEAEGSTLLAVEDDGVGIPEMKAARRGAGGTMGMMLVWTLAKQIGAEVAVTVQGGTRVQLCFRVHR